jgi:hypothetical protein
MALCKVRMGYSTPGFCTLDDVYRVLIVPHKSGRMFECTVAVTLRVM